MSAHICCGWMHAIWQTHHNDAAGKERRRKRGRRKTTSSSQLNWSVNYLPAKSVRYTSHLQRHCWFWLFINHQHPREGHEHCWCWMKGVNNPPPTYKTSLCVVSYSFRFLPVQLYLGIEQRTISAVLTVNWLIPFTCLPSRACTTCASDHTKLSSSVSFGRLGKHLPQICRSLKTRGPGATCSRIRSLRWCQSCLQQAYRRFITKMLRFTLVFPFWLG